MLDKKKWKFDHKTSYGNNTSMFIKAAGRQRLFAVVNKLGIIDHFEYWYRNDTFMFVYSKKYDQIFRMNYGTYSEKIKDLAYNVSDDVLDIIYSKIKDVYKEVK